ncbi:MAG: hypothetical protein ISS93_02795 [Candidatus Aenigmarchaeota archaeon]|nr:hypothetical protein [Candidatus Aenigmarchaeota archaeon]
MEAEFERIKRLLEEKGIWFKTKRHEAVFTSEQAARVRGVPLKMGVKALVCKAGEEFIMVLVRADKKADLKVVARLEGVKKLHLASPEQVFERTDCKVGAVPPFGFEKPLKTYLDKEVLEEEEVTFNAGLHEVSVVMKGRDLLKVLDPILY